MRFIRFVTLCLLAVGATAEPAATVLTASQARPFASVARTLAKGGHVEGVELARLVKRYGPQAAGAKLVAECEKGLGRAKKKKRLGASAASALERAVRSLERELPKREDPALAAFLVAVDADCAPAREKLGHRRFNGAWRNPREIEQLQRRAKINDLLRRARRMPVALKSGESHLPMFKRLHGKPGRWVGFRGTRLHSADVPEGKLRRTLTSIVRASAVWNELFYGASGPRVPRRELVLLASKPMYQRWRKDAFDTKLMNAEDYKWTSNHTWFHTGPYCAAAPAFGADLEAILFYVITSMELPLGWQPSLYAGQLNWISYEFLGSSMPRLYDRSKTRKVEGRTVGRRITEDRKSHERLANAGVTGVRAWMAYLARRGEDPKWWESFHARLGDFGRDELLKATLVAAYLNECGRFIDTYRKAQGATGTPSARRPRMEQAVGQKLPEFERDWRAWLLQTGGVGILQRLGSKGASVARPAFLRYLDALRLRAIPGSSPEWLTPITLEPELSAGALLHARYLQQNPAQQPKWPDAHEEYADKPGFTAAGTRAGGRSVITFGKPDAKTAIDDWLGTFYHRLPLLVPGILRVGFAIDGGIAVMDCTSLVDPLALTAIVCFPPPGEKNVPRKFNPELPNPVPGEVQENWGYPVTLQSFGTAVLHAPGLTLHEGKANGPMIECHVSVPGRPTNPAIDPLDTFALIPKRVLKSKQRYFVVGKHPHTGKPLNWEFTTGK